MKGKFMFALAAVGMLALTSCKSDWDCKCEYDGMEVGSGTFKDVSESDAEEMCDDLENTSGAEDQSWKCTLSEK